MGDEKQQLDRIEAKLNRIETALNGDNATKGILTRVALLEDTVGRWSKLIFAAVVTSAGAAITAFWNAMFVR